MEAVWLPFDVSLLRSAVKPASGLDDASAPEPAIPSASDRLPPIAQLRFASLTTGRLAASTHKATFSIPPAARLPAAKADFVALRKTFCAWPLRGPERPASERAGRKRMYIFSQCNGYRRCGVRGLGIVLFARWIPRFSARLSARFLVASFFYATVLPKSSMPWLRPFCADCADH